MGENYFKRAYKLVNEMFSKDTTSDPWDFMTMVGSYPTRSTSCVPTMSSTSVGASTYVSTPLQATPASILTLSNGNNSEIVKITKDGSVVWGNGIKIDEAAEAFSKSLSLSVELSAGITKKVKLQMRDSIFEDLISIAKEKGTLSADDLTYMLSASKIVEKLKGGNE